MRTKLFLTSLCVSLLAFVCGSQRMARSNSAAWSETIAPGRTGDAGQKFQVETAEGL